MFSNFKIVSHRTIKNPYKDSEIEMHIIICDVKNIPNDFPMGTNPREQNIKSPVAKKIRKTLVDEIENQDFCYLNRGILLSAKSVNYNNDTASIEFSDLNVHGNIDGGHTYKIILDEQNNINYNQQFVKIEVLTGAEDMFIRLASSRNTSVQVKDSSIAELEDKYSIIKDIFYNEQFYNKIYFKENQEGSINVLDIIQILSLFNIDKMDEKSTGNSIYASKGNVVFNSYMSACDNKDITKNPFYKMKHIAVDIIKLYDYIDKNLQQYYTKKTKRYYAAISCFKKETKKNIKLKTLFYENDVNVLSPLAFILPILGSLRFLIYEKDGFYRWIQDPFKVIDKFGPKMIEKVVLNYRENCGESLNILGKRAYIWNELNEIIKDYIGEEE